MICPDTNVLIDSLREDTDTFELEKKLEEESVCVTATTLFELLRSALMKGNGRGGIISAMTNTFDVLNLDKEASKISAEIYISSKKNGFKRYGVKLETKDWHFSGIDGLEVHRASSYIFSIRTLKFLRLNR